MLASALLVVGMGGLSVRSYIVYDGAGIWFSGRHVIGVVSTRGSFSFLSDQETRPPYGMVWTRRAPDDMGGRFGFGWKSGVGTLLLSVPHWLLMLLFATAYWRLRRRVRRMSHVPGTCKHCGYDLRASPERCPECGTRTTIHVPHGGNPAV